MTADVPCRSGSDTLIRSSEEESPSGVMGAGCSARADAGAAIGAGEIFGGVFRPPFLGILDCSAAGGWWADARLPKIEHAGLRMSASTSSSDSESGSSDSRSSSAARRRDRRERKRERRHAKGSKREKRESGKRESGKRERREKKRRRSKGEKREKKEKRHKRDKEQVQRSIITGKRIHRRDGDVADAEGEARRAALLAHMNEGEGVVWEGPAAAAAGRRGPDRAAEQARSDPALMRRLLEQGQEALASKRQRLGALVRSEADGYNG